MQNVNVAEGQTMEVLRYANRVPLQFQQAACAITQTVMHTNWRSYGLQQSRGRFAARAGEHHGAYRERVGAVHQRIERSDRQLSGNSKRDPPRLADCWSQAGDVSESPAESEAAIRSTRDLPAISEEVSGAVSEINGAEANALYEELLKVAKKVTADADMKMDDRGRKVSTEEIELAKDASVLIVDPLNAAAAT